jgi:cold shock protein
MLKGTVKWFNETKGYGFIQPDEGGADVFVHISALQRSGLKSLPDNQRVTYEIAIDPKRGKSSAVNIKLED